MYGPQGAPSRLPERSRSGGDASARLRPDPRGHARALIESFGYRSALQIARNNAFIERSREDYWPRVLDALQNEHA
jgi:hypothetical protein